MVSRGTAGHQPDILQAVDIILAQVQLLELLTVQKVLQAAYAVD
jgi:hypothetical protein